MFWRTQTKLKGLTPAIGASPNFVLPQKVLSDSNNYLYKCLTYGVSYHLPRLAEVVRHINNSTQTNIKTFANIACLSEKQFSRVFSEHIGTTPKDFLRVVRMQRTLSVLQHNPGIGFARLSYECGYTDQSHMIKEFKLFSGCTPKEYLARYTPVSDYFNF